MKSEEGEEILKGLALDFFIGGRVDVADYALPLEHFGG